MFYDMYNNIPTPDAFEEAHPYDDDIETTMFAWNRLADSYNEKVGQFSSDLYQQLANIKCKKVLSDQMITLGKTQFHNHDFNKFSEEDFKDLKEILLFQIDKLFKRRIFKRFKNLNFAVSSTDNTLTDENTMKSNQINHTMNQQPSCHLDNDHIETAIHAWRISAKSYSEEAKELSSDLYKQLSKIKCKKILKNQMIRLGKTQFRNQFLTSFQKKISMT